MSNYDEQDRESLISALEEYYDREELENCTTDELQDWYDDFIEEEKLGEFLSEELTEFQAKSLTTKEQLLDSIKNCQEEYAKEATSENPSHSLAFYKSLDTLLEKFQRKVIYTTLPEPLPDWWSYSYQITCAGIRLALDHYSWSYRNKNFDCYHNEKLTLFEVPARRLTVSEFAQLYGIEVVTVRQWIRRGKIRSAIKFGKEWRIPELAEISKSRAYTSCRYNWTENLTDLPEKYAYLNHFKSALFTKDDENSDQYVIALDINNADEFRSISEDDLFKKRRAILRKNTDLRLNDSGEILMTRKEREELELYMISHPMVYCKPYQYEFYIDECLDEIGRDYCPLFMWVTEQ